MSRQRRSAGVGVVAVVGAPGGLGAGLASALETELLAQVRPVVTDPRDAGFVAELAGADAVVHLDTGLHGDRDGASTVARTAAVLRAARAAGVARVVLLSSATVYGAHPDNPVPLPDDAPLRAEPSATLHGDLLQVELLAERARSEGLAVAVLRPASLVGPGTDDPTLWALDAPRLLVVRGTEPRWQFCHLDDLHAGVVTVLREGLEGALPLGCEGSLDQAAVERIAGKRHLELPMAVAQTTAERLHRLGVSAPPGELAYAVHPWVVAATRLRAAGWRPVYDNESALRAHLADRNPSGRGIDPRTATRAAAGATALIGTAALIRRARRRRGQ